MPAPTATKHVSSYEVLVDGQAVQRNFADRISEIRVISSLAAPDVCTLKVMMPMGEPGKPEPIDSMPFMPGKAFEVKLGEKEARAPKKLFGGEIVTVEPHYGTAGIEVLVRAYDKGHRLTRARHVRSFQNQTASDIVKKICGEAGLQATTESSGSPFKFMQQANETDWDFIWRLADRIGFEFVIVDGKCHFRKPDASATPVELEYPVTLFGFHPKLTAVQQVDEVSVRAFDPKTKSTLVGQAKQAGVVTALGTKRDDVRKEFPKDKVLVATEPVADTGSATKVAQALLDRMANGYASADGHSFGNPKLRGGAVIDVTGVGKRFGGKYRIHTATHVLRGGGVYETQFTTAPSYTITAALGRTSSGAPAFTGQLALALVTNNKDPDGMGRVKVKYPALSDSEEGWWARVAVPAAGNTRGMMMLPVVGEEVLVAFEHGDITRPYVIGSLFNGKDKPGTDLAAEDGSFGLLSDKKILAKSKEEMTLDATKAMTVKTADAMKLEATKNLDAKATQSMSLKATQQMVISGDQSVEIKTNGSQLKISSVGMLEISAANLKLSAQGMVQISGSQIMLG